MNKVIYGLHTGEAKKQITYREYKKMELMFGTSFPDESHACSQFFKNGVSKFWIEEVKNKTGKQYWLHLRVNMARAVGVGEYCLMPYTISNVKKMIREISKVLKKLKLQDKNADFGEWRWERFDSAFDVEEAFPELFMSLLDKSLNVNANKRQCQRKLFIPANPNVCESIRFGNDSYIYNIYIKLADLKNNGITITSEILREVTNIIRIERQNHLSAIKNLLPNGLVKDLTLTSVRDAILKKMIEDEIHLPTFVGNDANVAGLAEAYVGNGKGYDVVQYITMSTGIGGGLIMNKKMITGKYGLAQEVGSMVIKNGGYAPSIYKPKGCIEGEASGTMLTIKANEAGLNCAHAGDLFIKANEGNEIAIKLVDTFIDDVAAFISSIVSYMEPDIFVLGGGLMKSKDYFLDRLIKRVDELSYKTLKGNIKIVVAKYDQDCGIIGAAMQCFN